MELEFHGATDGTTGSCHVLRAGGKTVLLECGMFQGRRDDTYKRNSSFRFAPGDIDAVVLSHAHIDHSGKLPMLVRMGFEGRVHATGATVDLAEPMLLDSAMIQLKDAEFLNKRRVMEKVRARREVREGRRRDKRELASFRFEDDAPALAASNPPTREILPLYLEEDVRETLPRFSPHRWGEWFEVGPALRFRLHDAGHILGASWVECEARERGRTVRLCFTGDYGRPQPILRDPEPLEPADILISESTYGDRCHPPTDDTEAQLELAVERLHKRRRGKLLIPAFAVGRTQHILYSLGHILERRKIDDIPVYVDSPLAKRATEIVYRHPECFDEQALARLRRAESGKSRLKVRFTQSVDDSKLLNQMPGPMIVVSASGMMESGRILHHLAWGVSSPDTEIAVVGYQAHGTLGRRIVEGATEVNILGMSHVVRARVTVMNGFSAHADRDGLLQALTPLAAPCKALFLVHGENDQRLPLARTLRERGFARVECPRNSSTWKF
ncbi:MAG: MBL fold metallo-hydrolase [Planctomycetota bacterium]|nr:MBL fold metallo-hydrolase [Planctomycetota bacterium]